jgi:N-acetylglutamate synthase-like GNAT family acetyltransferase
LETKDEGRRTVEIRRARRGDIPAIAALVQKASRSQAHVDEAEVMDWLFGKGLLVASEGNKLVGVAAWQTENLLSVTDVFYVSPARLREQAGGGLLTAIEAEVNVLMCEANVLLLPAGTTKTVRTFLQKQGYEPKAFEELHRIWREVLDDLVSGQVDLMVKRLRDQMVMAPV